MRNVGLDVHKEYTYFTEVDDHGVKLRSLKVDNEALPALFSDGEPRRVVLEAGRNWYHFADALEGLVDELVLAHPLRVKAIASAKVKTDKVDSETLAQLLRADLVPTAYLAPPHVREGREVLRRRAFLVRLRTRVKNRIHAVLAKRGILCPWSDLFGKNARAWLERLPLPGAYRGTVDSHLKILDALTLEIQLVEAEIDRRFEITPDAALLDTIPGIGVYGALLLVYEIGDVHRFPDASHLVSHGGMAPIVRSSGGATRLGPISKQGSPWIRWIMVQAVHGAVRKDAALRERYNQMKLRRGEGVATVALARYLLKVVYKVLTTQRPYRAPAGAAPTVVDR